MNSLSYLKTGAWIHDNDSLISMEGLNNLELIDGYLDLSDNPALASLSGLENLEAIGSYLHLSQNGLTDLSALSELQSIKENLFIINNDQLTSLSGLDHVFADSISELKIFGNALLQTCDVRSICDYLAGPHGIVEIYDNAPGCNSPEEVEAACETHCLPEGITFTTQEQIDNFQVNYPGCTEIEGDVIIGSGIENRTGISNLNGLNGITSIGGNLNIGAWDVVFPYDLTSLEGLENLTSVGGWLEISGSQNLTNLMGLEGLTSIGDRLVIFSNSNLTNLTGLDNLSAGSILNLYISYNPSLSICEIETICNYLASPNGIIDVRDNAPGCNSPEEVNAACTFSVEPIGLDDEIMIFPNPADKTVTISGSDASSIREIVIYNQTGQKVLQSKPVNNTLDISILRPGMYIVELVTNQGKVREKLMVE